MPLLPDLAAAAIYAVVVFLLSLGVLVVFVETIPRRVVVLVLLVSLAFAIVLVLVGESGAALMALGFVAAILANNIFEWLTTR